MKSRLLYIFFLFFSASISAQDSLKTISEQSLKEVVINYQANERTPVTFQNISSELLKVKSIGQEPSFIFSETPSVTNYSDAGNSQGYSYFRLRGIDQTRINISLDGVPLNEPEDQGAYFSNYPDLLNSASKIQIQRGIGTSKNGVASYAGSIQLFSPRLDDSAYTTVGIGYGSFKSLRAYCEYNSGIKKRRALYIRTSQIYSDGYKYNSSNNSRSVFISGGLFFDKSTWKINMLAGQQQNQLAWLGVSDSLISIDRRTNANKNEQDKFTQCLGQIQNSWRLNSSSTLESSVYATYLNGNYDFNLNGFLGLPTTSEMYNYAFESNLFGLFSNYTFRRNNLSWTTGIHANKYSRQHIGSENSLGQLYRNTGNKNEASLFTKISFKLNRLSFFADIQYRYTTFEYVGSVPLDKFQWQFLNPKVGVSFDVNKNATVYYSAGSSGREPTRNDMFGGSDDLLSDSTGNAMISISSPEYVVDHELGVRLKDKNFVFNFNVYYLDFKNEIVLNGKFGPNGLALTNNVAKSFRTGAELNVSYKLGKYFMLVNNSSFNFSRIKEQSEIFSPILTPPFIVNQEVIYSLKGLSISIAARYQHQSFIDFANTSLVNSYLLLNTRCAYDFEAFQVAVCINNLTNAKYFNNGYVDFDGMNKYFVQAPLNFYSSITYSF